MTISFLSIPATIRTPGQFIEFDNSRAVQGLAQMPNVTLFIGPRLAAGSIPDATLVSVASTTKAEEYFGHSSILAGMIEAYKTANPYVECWAIGMTDNVGGVTAAGTFTWGGAATAAGSVVVYIMGHRIETAIPSGTAAAAVGPLVVASVVAYCLAHNLPVVATGPAAVTTITCLHKGTYGNAIDLRINYQVGEALPAGITCAIVAMANGTLTINMATAIAVFGAQWFTSIVSAYSDDTNMDLLETEMDSRWGPMIMHDVQCFLGMLGSQATLTAAGNGRNSKHTTLMGGGLSPTAPWIWAAVAAALDTAEPDPARPRQTLLMTGCKPPAPGAEFTWLERNTLLSDGVSTYTVNQAGECRMERLITTYQLNGAGAADVSYMDITTLRTLAYMRYTWRAWVALRFPRHKLADDGTLFGAGQAIVTPSIIKSEALAWFKEMVDAGLAEGFDQFKTDILVVRSSTDVNRVDMRMSPDVINQFMVLADQIQFLL